MTCHDGNFRHIITALSRDIAFSAISFTCCHARKDCVRKPELTCLLSENAGWVGRPRDASGLYATPVRAPDILGLLWIRSISLCRVAVTPNHISWVLRVLIFSRQKALCLVTVVFSDSYSISKNLHILLCTVRYFNAFYLQFDQKIVEVENDGSDGHTQSYCPLQVSLIRLHCPTLYISRSFCSLWEPADLSLQRHCAITQIPRDSVTAYESPNAQKIYCNAATREISAESPGICRGPVLPS